MLGEGRNFTHINESSQPHLIEIPWLTIEKQADTDPAPDIEPDKADENRDNYEDKTSEEQKVIERLRALGYYE